MECKKALENLVTFLDGELDQELCGQIRRHLESCPACNKETQLLSKTGELLAKFPDLEPKEKVTREIQEKVRAVDQKKPGLLFRRGGWRRIAVFATAASLIIAFGIYSVVPGPKPPTTDRPKVIGQSAEKVKTKLNYYKEILANFQEVKEEYYWRKDDLKTLSPYLFSEEWKF